MDPALTPGNAGRDCLGNGAHYNPKGELIAVCCDECDYQICCTKDDDEMSRKLCGECFAAHGECEIKARHLA